MKLFEYIGSPRSITFIGYLIATFLVAGSFRVSSWINNEFSALDQEFTARAVSQAVSQWQAEERQLEGAVSHPEVNRMARGVDSEEALLELVDGFFFFGLKTDSIDIVGVRNTLLEKDLVFRFGQENRVDSSDLIEEIEGGRAGRGVYTFLGEHDGGHYVCLASRLRGGFQSFLNDEDENDSVIVLGRALSRASASEDGGSDASLQFHLEKEFEWPEKLAPLSVKLRFPQPRSSRFLDGGRRRRGGRDREREDDSNLPREFLSPLEGSGLSRLLSEASFYLDLTPVVSDQGETLSRVLAKLPWQSGGSEIGLITELRVPRDVSNSVARSIQVVKRTFFVAAGLIIWFVWMVGRQLIRRRQAESELYESLNELTETNQHKDRLLSIIAHDLRAPLTGVVNLSGLMLKAPSSFSGPEIKSFAGEIQQMSKGLSEMLENLLSWAKLQTGRMPFHPDSVDLVRMAREVVSLHRALADLKNVSVNSDFPEKESVWVETDPEMLRTILRNLYSNAIRYNVEGGTVTISIVEEKGGVTTSIVDSGVGMTQEKLNDLFQVSIHDRTERKGFGLVLAAELARRIGGQLQATTELHQGSAFELHIPFEGGQSDSFKQA